MAGTIRGETKVIFLFKASFCNFDYLVEQNVGIWVFFSFSKQLWCLGLKLEPNFF
jgi:hypothetical protein